LSVVRSAVVAGRAGPPLRPGSRVSGVLSLWHTAHIANMDMHMHMDLVSWTWTCRVGGVVLCVCSLTL
jgi:hypothetical protein